MKLALSMYSAVAAVKTGRIDLMAFIDYAAAQNVPGLELLDIFWTNPEREIPAIKQRLADAGLTLAVYSISNNFIHPHAKDRQRELDDFKRGVDTAKVLGVDLMRVFSGSHIEGLPREQGQAWILEGLSAGAAYAQQHNLTLALENHGLFAGRSDQLRHIIDAINSPALRLNLDTGNFLPVGQDPLAAAADLLDLIALVHLKDMRPASAKDPGHIFTAPDGQLLTGCVLGDGLVNLPDILALLRDNDYNGWLSLEYEGPQDPLTIGIPRSLAQARQLLA